MKFKIYLPKSYDFYDGVKLYIKIIELAMVRVGYTVEYIDETNIISNEDVVLTISPYDFFHVLGKKPRRIIHWVQGIAPEETLVNDTSFWGKYRRYLQYRFMEWYILKKASVLLFVSKNMVNHYHMVYGYNNNNYVIMPCFNMPLDQTAFYDEKYQSPSFVYTGSLAGWQCFPETMNMYLRIKREIPNAALTVFTKEQDGAKNILKEKGITADVRYLPAEQLALELKKFKYGFLIREDIEVNRVATPIKMNTYMANGIIPIYSGVIGAFKENLGHLKYSVIVNKEKDLSKLMELEKTTIKAQDVYQDFKKGFEEFYSVSFYIELLSHKFITLLNS